MAQRKIFIAAVVVTALTGIVVACSDGNTATVVTGTPDASTTTKDASTTVDAAKAPSCDTIGCSADATCAMTSGVAVCACNPGFSGDGMTCTSIDDCAGSPCKNGGTCADGAQSYTCTCAAGYSGKNCETNIDDCAANPCLNGATCADGVNAYTCTCAAGYSGKTCDTNIDECAANPCLNGGTCSDGVNAYTCACKNGFSGATCATPPTSCKAIKTANAAAVSGAFTIDPDGEAGAAPFSVYCDMTTDGGGWTIVTSVTGAANGPLLTGDTEVVGNPLAATLQASNLSLAKKVAIAGLSTQSLFYRPTTKKFIKLSAPFLDASVRTPNTHVHKSGTLTASDGTSQPAYFGYSNFNNAGGGDFGISLGTDGTTCGGAYTTTSGFDHHVASYYHLNCSCERQYLYSYGSGGGYDVNTGLGDWAVTNVCDGNPGGALVFYAAMR